MLTCSEGNHPLPYNKHKRPTPHRGLSVRLILIRIECDSFRFKNKRRISKYSGRSEPFGTELCQWEIYINELIGDSFALLAMT